MYFIKGLTMRRKITAILLILANVLTLASCQSFGKEPQSSIRNRDDDDTPSHAQVNVFKAVEKITSALADCDEDIVEYCEGNTEGLLEIMPVVDDDTTQEDYQKPDQTLVAKNMIAATISYEIDEKSFDAGFLGKSASVTVKFTYKDYRWAISQRDLFMNPGDFNDILYKTPTTKENKLTLEFKRSGNEYLLTNPEVLVVLYDYDMDGLEFMRSIFDMVDNIYLTGDNYDPKTDSYYHTNTFEIVLELNDQAQEYIWQYIYRVVEETSPKWTNIYQSGTITENYPKEIRVVYTQDEIFTDGFYAILFYNYYDDTIIGMEFNVYENEKNAPTPTPTPAATDGTENTVPED